MSEPPSVKSGRRLEARPFQSDAPMYRHAVASGVFAMVCLLGLGWLFIPLAITCGHLALREISRQPGLRGRRIAVSALVVGWGCLALWVAYGVWAVQQDSGTP